MRVKLILFPKAFDETNKSNVIKFKFTFFSLLATPDDFFGIFRPKLLKLLLLQLQFPGNVLGCNNSLLEYINNALIYNYERVRS